MSYEKKLQVRIRGKLKTDFDNEVKKSGKNESEIQREALRAFLDEKQKRLGNRVV